MAELKAVKLYVPKSVRILQPTAPAQYNDYIQQSVKELKPQVENLAIQATPLGAEEWLANSIKVQTLPGMITVEWTAPYAAAVEKGSRPHLAPIRAIMKWTLVKLREPFEVAYAIRASIAKHGTKPARYLQDARSRVYKYAVPAFRERMKLLARFLSGDFGP